MTPETRRVIVVGAGISGLACAYRLNQSGLDTTVIEASGRPGGVIRTIMQNGFLCEGGPNSFQNTLEIMALVKEAGLENELITADSRLPRFIFYRGRLHPAPMGPGGLLVTRLLTAGAKVRLLREPWVRPHTAAQEESLAEFVTRRFGPQVLRNLVAPFVSGIYAGEPAELSTQSVFPQLVEFEKKHGSVLRGFFRAGREVAGPRRPRLLCSFRDGMQALPRKLAEKIGGTNILLNSRAESIAVTAREGRNVFVVRTQTGGGALELDAASVVVATTARAAARLIESRSPAAARELASIDYPPLTGVFTAYKATDVRQLNGFGFLVPRREGVRILGCIWSSSLFPGRAPHGSILLTSFIGGATDVAVASSSDQEIIEAVKADLRRILGITIPPVMVALHRHERAIPQYTIGHAARLQRIGEEMKKTPGIFLAGNYSSGVSVGDCVKQANEVADEVRKFLA